MAGSSGLVSSHEDGGVVIVAQMGTRVDGSPAYGTLRATLELARYLSRAGRAVTLLVGADEPSGVIENVPFLGHRDEGSVGRALAKCGPIETLIGISRADIFRKADARRRIVYHHGPHPIQEDRSGEYASYPDLNRIGVHVVCPSRYSQDQQIALGMDRALTHAVRNGFDRQTFCPNPGVRRSPHSLLFVGHVIHHKGVDIILRAFELLKRRFPDAMGTIAGRQFSWLGCGEHRLSPSWADAAGMLQWRTIERDIPGIHYAGEVSALRLAGEYRSHSLLLLASRVPETFGLVSLEAQGCGCLPVLPRQGGFPETIREGETGYLYDGLSPEHIAERISDLWERGLPADTQRSWAQAWVAETFAWERTGREFLDIMTRIPPSCATWRRWLSRRVDMRRLRRRVDSGVAESWWWLMRQTQGVRHAGRTRA